MGVWRAEAGEPQEPPGRTRVVVIGASYAGLSAALEFARSGIQVTVIDAALPADRAWRQKTARFPGLRDALGRRGARPHGDGR